MIRKLADFEIYRDARFFSAFPSVAPLDEGGIAVAFRRAPDSRWFAAALDGADAPSADLDAADHIHPRSHVALMRLGADLAVAGPPQMLPVDPECADQDANLLRLQDGALLQWGFSWYPLPPSFAGRIEATGGGFATAREDDGCIYLRWGCYARRSEDGGRHWSDRTWLPPIPRAADLVPGLRGTLGGAARGRAVEGPDGTLLLATYYNAYVDDGRAGIHIYCSDDGGRSWAWLAQAAGDPALGARLFEPALAASGGGIAAFMRSSGLEDRLVTAFSPDGGATWRAPFVHEVVGHPYDPLVLADGRLLLVYGYRHEPCGVRARLIEPSTGEAAPDIAAAPEFVIRDDAAGRDVGYPWALEIADGRVLVVYYFCGTDGVRHIAASVLEID